MPMDLETELMEFGNSSPDTIHNTASYWFLAYKLAAYLGLLLPTVGAPGASTAAAYAASSNLFELKFAWVC